MSLDFKVSEMPRAHSPAGSRPARQSLCEHEATGWHKGSGGENVALGNTHGMASTGVRRGVWKGGSRSEMRDPRCGGRAHPGLLPERGGQDFSMQPAGL